MCEYENSGCRNVRDEGCGCGRSGGRGICDCFGSDTLLIVAIIILFVLLFCDCCD